MKTTRWAYFPLILLVGAVGVSSAADDAMKNIQLAKSATALVVLPGDAGSASAFCIDSHGIFVTNAHVVRDVAPGAKVSLVISAGEAGEQICQASTLRVDKEDDLAVLKAEGFKQLTALPLGSSDQLLETQAITAFGYPFGKALSLEKGSSPSISVNIAHVTSMRKSKGKLERIQIDSQLNPGNSGGPVIDEKGNVVGIVSSGVLSAGINFAVPVNKLSAFLDRPELLFTPPAIADDKAHDPVDLSIHTSVFGKAKPEMTVEVVLSTPGGVERSFQAQPTEADKNTYALHVVPLPARTGGSLLAGVITFADGSIHCILEDQTFQVDGKPFKLSQLSNFEFHPGATVLVNRDGSKVTGNKVVIAPLAARFGAAYSLAIDATKATSIAISQPEQGAPTVNYRIVARSKGVLLAETKGTLLGVADTSTAVADGATEPGGATAVANAPPPAPAGGGPWIELMRRVDLKTYTDSGTWTLQRGAISNVHPNNHGETCRLTIPVIPTGNYEFDFTCIRRTGTQDMCILFPCGGHGAMIWLGAFTGQLSQLEGTPVKGRSDIVRIVNDHPYRVALTVTNNGATSQVDMKINGVDFLSWSGDPSTLQVNPERATRDGRTLGLAVYASTTFDFSDLRVRAITGTVGGYVEGK